MIAASIAILSSAAVVSTGFAAWVISGGDTKQTSGTITADSVSESYHTITFTSTDKNKINFGAPENDITVKNPWLTNDSMGQEKLLAQFTFTVANVKTGEIDTPNKLFSSITLEAENGDKYNAAANATPNLISALPSWNKDTYDGAAPTYDSKTATDGSAAGIYLVKGPDAEPAEGKPTTLSFTLYIQFTWGKAFDYINPFYFYNKEAKTASTDGSDAKTKLGTVAEIQNVNFNLKITTK